MAQFYGKVIGQRGPGASRLGNKASGLEVVAASWQGAVKTVLYEKDGKDWYKVLLVPWHGAGVTRVLAEGVVGEEPFLSESDDPTRVKVPVPMTVQEVD